MPVVWEMVIPFLIYLVVLLVIGFYAYKIVSRTRREELSSEFYLSRRQLGPIVLAFTLLASWASAGAFIGTPGMGYGKGWFAVLIAIPAASALFLVLGGLGKKLAIVARKIKAITLPAVLRERFNHPLVGIGAAVMIVVFLTCYMTAQFIGGARIFEAVAGFPFTWGVVFVGVIVLIYTVMGGFRAVCLTDTLQGILMVVLPILIFVGFFFAATAGGSEIGPRLMAEDPKYVTPDVGGTWGLPYIFSLTWLAIGISAIGSPHLVVRAMAYKDSKTMHRAIILGTGCYLVMAILLWTASTFAVLIAPGVTPADMGTPTAITQVFPALLAGIIFIVPFAALMSTVDSFLLVSASGVVEDIYVRYINPKVEAAKKFLLNRVVTLILGLIVFTVALFPPPAFLQYIIWYALGGLTSAFLIPLLFGLYWPRANRYGAIASIFGGAVVFIIFQHFKIWGGVTGVHGIVPGMIASALLMVIVSLLTKRPSRDELQKFWG